MKKSVFIVILGMIMTCAYAQKFRNTRLSDDARIADLISQLTFDEKIHLLSTDLGVERLGIPRCGHFEGLHGLCLGGEPGKWGRDDPKKSTIFPQSYGLGCTWDTQLLHDVASQMADEARYYMHLPDCSHRALVMRSPNADLARDPRWGRTEESYGEDPQLVGTLTAAFARGMQGDDRRYWKTASLMKHFLANSNEDGRDSTTSDFDARLFREYYSYPFYKGMKDGGAQSFMAAYNGWNGIPMAMHPCLRDIVRDEWGMKGIICTDGSALTLMHNAHHAFPTRAECAAAILKVSTGQYLDRYVDDVKEALDRGLITEQDIDHAIRYNLYTALKLGLLDDKCPYANKVYSTPPYMTDDARALARRAVVESAVLLKNTGILPIDTRKVKRIAVIGPYADHIVQDWYSGDAPYEVTILEALREATKGECEVTYAASNSMGVAQRLAREADLVIACVGNHPYGTNRDWKVCPVASDGREAVDRKSLMLPDEELLRQLYAVNKQTVLVLVSSFPYAIGWSKDHLPAILHITHCAQEQGNGVADILLGNANPAGRTTQTWVNDITELPDIMDYDIRHGRTYLYYKGTPLFPFGYGLSYTTFRYDAARISRQDKTHIYVDVDVTNTGQMDGDEVVQLYVSFPHSAVEHPARQLRAFDRVMIKSGETRTVSLRISKDDLRYWDDKTSSWTHDKSPMTISVGGSSDCLPLTIDGVSVK